MSRYGQREILDVVVKDIVTLKPILRLDSLKVSDLTSAATTVYARGGSGNPKLVGWDGSRDETFAMQDALISPESLSILFGSVPTVGATESHKIEVLTVDANNEITLSETPLGTNGADKFFFITNDGASLGVEQTFSGTPGANKYDIAGTTVSFDATSCPEGTLIIADYYYTTAATTKQIIVNANKFPGTYLIEGDTFWRLENGVDVPAKYTMHKAKILPGFVMKMQAEGEPSVYDFKVECLKATGSKKMVTIEILE